MKSCSYLTQKERYLTRTLMQTGCSQSEITSLLKRSSSTISWPGTNQELRHNPNPAGYWLQQAPWEALQGAYNARARWRVTAPQWNAVQEFLRRDWSPKPNCWVDATGIDIGYPP